jgi:hypothetical protein
MLKIIQNWQKTQSNLIFVPGLILGGVIWRTAFSGSIFLEIISILLVLFQLWLLVYLFLLSRKRKLWRTFGNYLFSLLFVYGLWPLSLFVN